MTKKEASAISKWIRNKSGELGARILHDGSGNRQGYMVLISRNGFNLAAFSTVGLIADFLSNTGMDRSNTYYELTKFIDTKGT